MTVEEEVEELLDGLTEYDDIDAMLEDLEDDVEVGDVEEGGKVFTED